MQSEFFPKADDNGEVVVKNRVGFADTFEIPTDEQMEEWLVDTMTESPDGCSVEHDGYCTHGWPSWTIVANIF